MLIPGEFRNAKQSFDLDRQDNIEQAFPILIGLAQEIKALKKLNRAFEELKGALSPPSKQLLSQPLDSSGSKRQQRSKPSNPRNNIPNHSRKDTGLSHEDVLDNLKDDKKEDSKESEEKETTTKKQKASAKKAKAKPKKVI